MFWPQRVLEAYREAKSALEDPDVRPDEAPDYIIFMAQVSILH
jgi:hypothetical protein